MKKHTLLALMVLAPLLGAQMRPAYGVSEETLQMLRQLEQAVQNLQKTVDTRTAVIPWSSRPTSVNTMKATITELQ